MNLCYNISQELVTKVNKNLTRKRDTNLVFKMATTVFDDQ